MNFQKELAGEIQNARQEGIDASGIWELFENATPEQQVMIFERTLETGVLTDDYAFEFLSAIRGDCDPDTPEGRAAYTSFLDQLREQAPKLYQQSSHYYHRDLISFAIIEGRWGDLPDLLTDYTSGDHLDLFTMVVAQLKYHGQVKILVEAMKTAYPKIEASSQYVQWAGEEFAGKLMEVMLVDYLETSADPRPDDPEFLEVTACLPSWKEGWLEWFIPTVTRPEPTEWKPLDFAGNPGSQDWQHKFATMQLECIAALWRAGVPLTRGLLAWHKWGEIFHNQHKTARKRKQKSINGALSRYLIPQAKQMDQTLGESFSLMGGEPYEVAAALELMPAYLDFLTDFGLIQPDEAQQAFQQIKPLVEQTPQILKYYESDPVAIQNMLAAWDI